MAKYFLLTIYFSSYSDSSLQIAPPHMAEMTAVISKEDSFGKIRVLKKLFGDHRNLIYQLIRRIPHLNELNPATLEVKFKLITINVIIIFCYRIWLIFRTSQYSMYS